MKRVFLGAAAAALLLWICARPGRAADPAKPRFRDVAALSRFSYISDNDFTGRKYFPQAMCGGIAAFDYDNDGLVDLYFTNGAKLPELDKTLPRFRHLLLHDLGGGRFEDVTARAGLEGAGLGFTFGVAAADYDNDGYTDLFLANAGRNALFHNNHDGTFRDVTVESGLGPKPKDTLSVQGAWFDYDRDGRLDLVVSNYTTWTPQSDVRCTANGKEYYCHPSTYPSVPHRLYHNLGNGRFEDVTEPSGFGREPGKGMGIAIADYNGDGWPDVFVANDTVRNFLFVNQHHGTFKEEGYLWGVAFDEGGTAGSSMGADSRDYDNDGWPDIFFNNLMGQIWGLYRNNGGEMMRYVSGVTRVARLSAAHSGWSLGFFDYDNDGWKDLYSSNGNLDDNMAGARQHDTLFRNLDGKQFEDVSATLGEDFLRLGFQRGSAFADLDNDGFQDLVVTSLGQRPRILMNTGAIGNHWLLVKLTGRHSNRDAIGARLKLTTASGRTLYNHVGPSVGFLSTSDRRVHFGLGTESQIASLEIVWPDGQAQVIRKPAADRILPVEEPKRRN